MEVESDQETSMHVQGRQSAHDEFQVELNRMRDSLNALTLKNFMFDGAARSDADDESENPKIEPIADVFFTVIDTDDIIAALSDKQENSKENIKSHVHFCDELFPVKAHHQLLEPSRNSDEVATINNELPWHKKHQYRTVTPFLKSPQKKKHEEAFRPIETSGEQKTSL